MTDSRPTPADERRLVGAVPHGLRIGGEWRPAASGATISVEDPSTGDILTEVADADEQDALAALDAAATAQADWAATAPRERGEILRRSYELIMERVDDLALLMTLEMGKPLGESRAEITYAAEFFRWFAEEAVRITGRYSLAPDGGSRMLVMRQPVGPSVQITPWNFPLAMGTRKIGPAVAAGCTMVVKPAQQTPLSMLALADLMGEAGLPAGVLNIITASKAGRVIEPLLLDPRTRKLSFTGSTEVGRVLLRQAADSVLRTSMELGGNAPFVVFDDADVNAAIDGAVLAKMRNIGEACTAANRFHVHESVAEEFTNGLAERMAAMKVGRGTDPDVKVGPLIDAKQRDKVAELVQDAIGKGASAVVGGKPLDGPGYFFPPTVLRDVPPTARILREEVFGPVAPVATFATEDEAVAAANNTEFGLVSYFYTRDLARALRVSERLETGMIGLNRGVVSNPAAPFGGVKQSGIGREGGLEGIAEYLEVKYIAMPS
ncbi:MAG: NAD-dependent succinate-semialdehyde dehydrogenase [Actinomycetota bacterium]|nr:NAD-dependent succinate-semialdehyde dehydrogenase [Actinomycetota bacterium]